MLCSKGITFKQFHKYHGLGGGGEGMPASKAEISSEWSYGETDFTFTMTL